MQGGAIRKVKTKAKRKSPKKEKIEQALAMTMQGGKLSKRKYYDAHHKYLSQKLTGKGGHLDSPYCREKMHSLMSKYHPSLFQSYLSGKVRDIPHDQQYHLDLPQMPTLKDRRPHVVDYGGSLAGLTHRENGLLMAHDSSFHKHLQLI